MAEPTFDCPDLDAFCLIDRLGLTVTGQRVGTDDTVLACRVVEPDDVVERSCWCARCGQLGSPETPWCGGWRTSRWGGGRRSCTSSCAATAAPAADTCGGRTPPQWRHRERS